MDMKTPARRLSAAIRSLSAAMRFVRDFRRFRSLNVRSPRFPVRWGDRFPQLHDRRGTTGFDRHYVYHLGWAARVIAETRPAEHVDVSSSVLFNAVLSAFVPVTFCEYHPPNMELDGLTPRSADLRALPFGDDSVRSLSCLHVVEHVGLGRYGGPLDPDGDLKAMRELRRVLAPGGQLLLAVPVGRPVLRFNAHRVYSYQNILDGVGDLVLKEFALVPDDAAQGGLIRRAEPSLVAEQSYGCGCFWFTKGPS
jgi:SAM-dependent methyltransferase